MSTKKGKQTQQGNLSKAVKDLLAEVDWDMHEQLEMEEEGQPVPMQDQPSPQFKTMSEEDSRKVVRVDPPEGFLKHVPKD